MKKILVILISGALLISCSKKSSENTSRISMVSFTYSDAGGGSISDTNCICRFSAVNGGNTTLDTTHGYVFSYSNGYPIYLSFEIPQLISGTYSYAAFSPSWPRPLSFDKWENQHSINADSATITINISRYSKGSLDGTFSLSFNNPSYGSNYIKITNGKFLNLPLK